MRIVAIDLGTTSGMADLSTTDGAIRSETWDLAPRQRVCWGERLVNLDAHLHCLGHADVIVYEMVRRHAGRADAHAYGALRGQLLRWCYEHHRGALATVEVAEWKIYAGLPGNAGKRAVAAEIERRWPGERLGQDEGEARLMALCYAAREGVR